MGPIKNARVVYIVRPRTTLAEDIDRTRPDQVAVFLRDAHVKRVVGLIGQRDTALELHAAMRVLVRHAEHAQLALDAAIREYAIVQADIGDLDFGFDERGVDSERTCLRITQPRIEARKPAGGQSTPFE